MDLQDLALPAVLLGSIALDQQLITDIRLHHVLLT